MSTPQATAPRAAPDQLSKVARGSVANLVGAVLSALANFGLTLMVAHYASRSAAGIFFTATSLFLMLEALGRLGADTGLVYFIARWRALGEENRIRAGLRVAFEPVVCLCAVLAVLVIVFAPGLARLIGDPHGNSVSLLRTLAVLLPVATAYDLTLGATRGFGWMRPTVLVEKIGRSTAQLVLVGAALAAGWAGAIGYAWALPYVAALGAATWMLRGAVGRGVGTVATVTSAELATVRRDFWTFALPRALASVAQVVLQRFDIVLVAAMRGVRDAAIYTAATRFLVMGQFLNQAITAPLQPHLSAAISSGATSRARELYRASTTWLVLASWPLFGAVMVLAPLYTEMFGHGYRSGAAAAVVLALAMLVASGVGLVDTVIIMAGKTSWNLLTTLLALAVNIGLDVALIPHLGVIGAAIGWLASILAANLVPLALSWWRLGMHPFGASTYRAYLLSGVAWVAIPGGAYLLSGRSELGAGVGVAVGAALYCVGLWRWRAGFHLAELLVRRHPEDSA